MTATRVVVQQDKDGPLEVREIPLPEPAGHHVQIRMIATGVCRSQLMWMGLARDQPVLFGHEGIGEVEAVGPDVTSTSAGDRVIVTWLPRAGTRPPERMSLPIDGGSALSPNVYTWASRIVCDELYVRPVSADTHPDACVVGCAVITGAGAVRNVGRVRPGDHVAVIGAGGVGLCAIAAATLADAESVIAVDLSEDKLDLARRCGATATVDGRTGDVAAAITALTPDLQGVDVVVDCVASQETLDAGMASLKPSAIGTGESGGRLVLVGVPARPLTTDLLALMSKGQELAGALAGRCVQSEIDEFLSWFGDGRLDLGTLVTDHYRFDDLPEAVEDLRSGRILGRAVVTF